MSRYSLCKHKVSVQSMYLDYSIKKLLTSFDVTPKANVQMTVHVVHYL